MIEIYTELFSKVKFEWMAMLGLKCTELLTCYECSAFPLLPLQIDRWLAGWLAGWQAGWQADRQAGWLADRQAGWLTDRQAHCFVHIVSLYTDADLWHMCKQCTVCKPGSKTTS